MVRDLKPARTTGPKQNRVNKSAKKIKSTGVRLRLSRRSLLHLLLLTVAGTGLWLVQNLQFSPAFCVQEILVEHSRRLTAEELRNLSGIALGQSLWDVDLVGVGQRLQQSPWVRAARVERVWPDRVRIRIVEHTPKAIVNLDYLYYVDDSGKIFKVLGGGDDLDYPVITGVQRQDALDAPEETRGRLLAALELLAELDRREVFGTDQISELNLDPRFGMTLFSRDGAIPVYVGDDEFVSKLDRLEGLYGELEDKFYAIEYIDLNVTNRVIVKVMEEAPQKG